MIYKRNVAPRTIPEKHGVKDLKKDIFIAQS
jgi:hypothetical protein